MKRRTMLLSTGFVFLGLSAIAFGFAGDAPKKKILYFTRSEGYVHPVVDRHGQKDKLSFSEKALVELCEKHGFDIECSQDPAVFEGDLGKYDLLVFYTSGNCLSERGKKNLLDAVAAGKGFVGIHAAADSFRSEGIDPYIAMIGGEFICHGVQQKSKMKLIDPKFPGTEGLGDGFVLHEEWYTFQKFASDLHVILLQETKGMIDKPYERPAYPATWARMQGKGRVFYTSMGHREDVWTNPIFQRILIGGIQWAIGNVNADVTPNIAEAAPHANQIKN